MKEHKRYFRVGISGHRDLDPAQKDENMLILQGHLLKLQRENPHLDLLVLTQLAEGADRMIAKVAIALGIAFDVILPMALNLYIKDFDEKSQKEFYALLKKAHLVTTIDLYAANTPELIAFPSIYRNFQYRQAGRKIVDLSNEVIIMSDGSDTIKMGGTADMARYAKRYGKIIYTIRCKRQQLRQRSVPNV